MEDLRPCPFCGVEAELIEHNGGLVFYSVSCKNENCFAGAVDVMSFSKETLVEAWNTRAEKMCRMVRKPTIDPYTDRAVCSGCGKSVPVSVGERMPNYCPNCGAKVVEVM